MATSAMAQTLALHSFPASFRRARFPGENAAVDAAGRKRVMSCVWTRGSRLLLAGNEMMEFELEGKSV